MCPTPREVAPGVSLSFPGAGAGQDGGVKRRPGGEVKYTYNAKERLNIMVVYTFYSRYTIIYAVQS